MKHLENIYNNLDVLFVLLLLAIGFATLRKGGVALILMAACLRAACGKK